MIKSRQLLYVLFTALAGVIALMNGCGEFNANGGGVEQNSTNVQPQLFEKVQVILKRDCVSCHKEGGVAASLNLNSPDQFVSAGFVVPGKPRSSKLVFRLKNFDDTTANNRNMPSGSVTLSDADYQTIYSWVLDMPSDQSPFLCEDDGVNLDNLKATNAKRLSLRQYRNSLIDLLGRGITVNTARSIVGQAMGANYLPEDTGVLFKRENNVFGGDHAQGFTDIADQLATALSTTYATNFIQNFIALEPGSCTSVNVTNLSQVCRNQLIRNFASRAFRRPLRDSSQMLSTTEGETINEPADLLEEFSGVSQQVGLSNIIYRVLLSPHFLFQIEDQNLVVPLPQNASVYTLSSHAIASRLAMHYWNTIPDETLRTLASTENLYTDDSYIKALNHILSQPRKLEDSMREYYNDWLHLDRTPRFTVNSRFSQIVNNVTFNDTLRSAMISEVEELGAYITNSGGGFDDLFGSNISFARDANLMRLYNQTTAAPVDVTETNAVRFPANTRSGLLTRAGLLISGTENTNPILRGIHIRRDILCLTLGAPPSNAQDEFDNTVVADNLPTREKVRIKTSGASCVSCHNQINPLGFGLSHFNAFGMFSNQEPIFNNTTNMITSYVDVDSNVDLSAIMGPGSTANGAHALGQMIAQQETAKVCFAEKFLSYALDRRTVRSQDACRLDKVYNNLDSGGRLVDMIRAAGLDMENRLRKID